MRFKRNIVVFIFICIFSTYTQSSKHDLSKSHQHLQNNCKACHNRSNLATIVLNFNKLNTKKCLDCHKTLNTYIKAGKGYHASKEVVEKECKECHSEHHGKNHKIVKFNTKTFNHSKTGFELKGIHAGLNCKECHKPAYIKDEKLKKRFSTYLGLDKSCLSCHEDYHQGKKSSNCTVCHNFQSFENDKGFNHNTSKFKLAGKHRGLSCDNCHETKFIDGKRKRTLRSGRFDNCNACHADVHSNKFGTDCKSCHTETSFKNIKGIQQFDHNKTTFELTGKHKSLSCKSCHKNGFTEALRHDHCSDCHADYHKGEFIENNKVQDCGQCHTTESFKNSTFTMSRHDETGFKLKGAHRATPCLSCHQTNTGWTFKSKSKNCTNCHTNVHKGFLEEKYVSDDNCLSCHNTVKWEQIKFDHDITNFKLDGKHDILACGSCHYKTSAGGEQVQIFKGLPTDCDGCHTDIHRGQFSADGKTNCTKCHTTDSWHKTKFDHKTSTFKLEGKHKDVMCRECHKESILSTGERYLQYKQTNTECKSCHL